ncbi:MAG: A24 family peptidase [Jatrophihabitantaceae bacterium]
MSDAAVGAAVAGVVCLLASPYLARLTLSVPDREDVHWWRGRPTGWQRLALTALVAVVLGVLGGKVAGSSALLPAFIALALTCTPLVLIDFEHHRLPNRLVFAAAGSELVLLTLAAIVRADWHSLLRAVEGAAAVYAVLFLLAFMSPRSFGFGDVKLGGMLGGYLGWFAWLDVYYGIFAGFVLGMLVAIVLLSTRRASMKTAMAFGPMLILGALLVLAFDITPTLR